jgi:NET1-associated nuclear protein 1 (U3 small nucleolar RNA-associated protein 17)
VTFHIIPSEGDLKALISFKDTGAVCFCVYDLLEETNQQYNLKINSNQFHIDFCGSKYFAIVHGRVLNVVMFKNLLKTNNHCIEQSREFTRVACHPDEKIILTGDNTGRVVAWQKIFSNEPSQAVFHWHTLPVRCLGFSTIGSHFYSGGNESVLVRWQLHNPLEKKFLPRLPSTIAQISVSTNNKFIAVSTDDNAVRILDSKLDSVSLIQHLVIGDNFQTGIVYDPRTRALVMNGNVGQVQFYSTNDNSLLYNVDVVGQNKISSERNCNIENTQVSKIAVSKNGLWMVTVESRDDPEFSHELRMKFWKFDFGKQNFKLNTAVENPHENYINSIAFPPTDTKELKFVSVGGDKKFYVWFLTETENVGTKTEIWKGLRVGYYHDLPCRAVSFSTDGSLVAVSFDSIVTTWVPDSCQLKCSLGHPIFKQQITQVEFGTSNQCHLLVAASDERLSVWNLLTLTMMWTVPVHVSLLMADPVTANMAIITKENAIFVFAPNSPEPVFSSMTLLKHTHHRTICGAAFVPTKYSNDIRLRWFQRSPIYFIDDKKVLYCLGAEDESVVATPSKIDEVTGSLFSMTIPQAQSDKSKGKEPVQHLYEKDVGRKILKKYLEAPIQTMIPIRLMCGSLLRSMVLQRD